MEQTFPIQIYREICILRITIHNNIARLFANKTKIRSHLSCKFSIGKTIKICGGFFLFIYFLTAVIQQFFVDAQSYFKINVNVLSILSPPPSFFAPPLAVEKYINLNADLCCGFGCNLKEA